jgi:uncharacterized membrane protein YhaH (DUF805 family)
MKIDTDPVKNREQFEKLRSFSANNMLIMRKGFWLFMGFTFIIASVFVFFGDPSSIKGGTKGEVALTFFGLGSGIIVLTILISYLFSKIGEYTPKPNRGDEWLK